MIPWIIIAAVAVPLVVIAFLSTRRTRPRGSLSQAATRRHERSRSSPKPRPTSRIGTRRTRRGTTKKACP